MVSRFSRLFCLHRDSARGREKVPQILAVVSQGPNRLLLQAISHDAGWALTVSEVLPDIACRRHSDVPPIIIYDRELAPPTGARLSAFLPGVRPDRT